MSLLASITGPRDLDALTPDQLEQLAQEVRELLADVGRLDDRAKALQKHFAQANTDIGDILTSTGKVSRRGERIVAMEFDEPERPRLAGE